MMKNRQARLPPLALFGAVGLFAGAPRAEAIAQNQPQPDANIEVQTRGPVHEAFADLVTFDPEPGQEIVREPPPAIEEIPPDQRPEGNQALWISGYWAWDDDSNDFVWVSGVWRVPPPAHTWVSGYWHRSGTGFRWVQGFWSPNQAVETAEVTYLSPPPESLEAGPSSPSPSERHLWTPGCWIWTESRYAWRPGCWIVADPEWVWVPACYQWTPGGHVFVEAHWDFLVERRGVLFAPVIFRRPAVAVVDYRYTPTIAIDLGVLSLHLFSRPHYNHYYFGDWYAPECWDRGIYPTFAFHMSVYGYDPLYEHTRWEHRRDETQWEETVHADFIQYRENATLRPQHTLVAQQTFVAQQAAAAPRAGARPASIVLARPVRELPAQQGAKIRLEAVPEDDRRKIAASGQQQLKVISERVKIEKEVASRKSARKEPESAPEKARLPKAPVVARAEVKTRPPAPPERAKPEEVVKAPPAPTPAPTPGPAPAPKGDPPKPAGKEGPPPARKPDVPAPTPKPDVKPGAPVEVKPVPPAQAKSQQKRRPEPQLPKVSGKPAGKDDDKKAGNPPGKKDDKADGKKEEKKDGKKDGGGDG